VTQYGGVWPTSNNHARPRIEGAQGGQPALAQHQPNGQQDEPLEEHGQAPERAARLEALFGRRKHQHERARDQERLVGVQVRR
jgi:hypothetical protein